MALVGLINIASGGVPDGAEAALRKHLGGDLTRLITCEGSGLRDALSSLALSKDDTLVVWGGDGTVSASLSHVKGTGAAVLPLPGGTMNLVHRRIHGDDLSWQVALDRALSSTLPEPIVYGRVGNCDFFVALMLGPLTNLAEAREALRDGAPIKAARTAVENKALTLDTVIDAQIDAETLNATAAAAFLPETLDGNDFDVGLIDPDTLTGLASTSFSALINDWRTAEGVTFRKATHVRFSRRGGTCFNALVDGEPQDVGSDVQLEIVSGDILVRTVRAAA
ncbi:MAG: diacylglycerol kinase family protein [Pseudomonadota bacterium]